jgi:hypothetical protein
MPACLGRIATFHDVDYHRDIGTLESLRRAEAEDAWVPEPAASPAGPFRAMLVPHEQAPPGR